MTVERSEECDGEHRVKLDVPDVYGPWIINVLKRRVADDDTAHMKDMFESIAQYSAMRLGMGEELLVVASQLHDMIVERTTSVVGELNLAMKQYGGKIPDTYAQTEKDGAWRLLEGFALGTDPTVIAPIFGGEAWHGRIVSALQDKGEDGE